jgi:hypothetical protein
VSIGSNYGNVPIIPSTSLMVISHALLSPRLFLSAARTQRILACATRSAVEIRTGSLAASRRAACTPRGDPGPQGVTRLQAGHLDGTGAIKMPFDGADLLGAGRCRRR